MENSAVVGHIRYLKEPIIELKIFFMSLRKQSPGKGSFAIDRVGWVRKKKIRLRLQRQLAGTKHRLHLLLDASTA